MSAQYHYQRHANHREWYEVSNQPQDNQLEIAHSVTRLKCQKYDYSFPSLYTQIKRHYAGTPNKYQKRKQWIVEASSRKRSDRTDCNRSAKKSEGATLYLLIHSHLPISSPLRRTGGLSPLAEDISIDTSGISGTHVLYKFTACYK